MKKTLYLISCVVASSLMAQGATLVSEWDGFTQNGAATTGNLTFNFGASSVSNGVLNVKADGTLANRPTVDLSSAGLSLYNGLTISLEVKGATANNNIFGLASSQNEHLFAAGTDGSTHGLFLFSGSSGNAGTTGNNTALGVTSTSTTSIITITTGWNGSNVVFKMYENGNLVASGQASDSSIAQQELTKLALGGWAGSSGRSTTNEDVSRLAIYNGEMSAGEVQDAYVAWTIVPEPATASLGLLGLGALLLRRRRQR